MRKEEVVWITGGGSGIGQALAVAYASRGACVVISGRREKRLQQVQKDIEASGGCCLVSVCDVCRDEEILQTLLYIREECGRLDIVIANAGFAINGRIEELTSADWHRQLNVNVIGAVQTARYALPLLQKNAGRIVLISSVMAYVRAARSGAYAASKAALTAVGETWHQELAGTGVSCTVVHPGFVESEIGQVDKQGVFHPEEPDRRPKKLLWSKEKAADVIMRAVDKRKRLFTFTAHGRLGVWMARFCPDLIYYAMSWKRRGRHRNISIAD